jgi:hypothetical protein
MGSMTEPVPETLPVPVEEDVEAIAVVAQEARALEPVRPPALQTAAVAATGFFAGAATIVVAHRRSARKAARRTRGRGHGLPIVGSRSFLVDVHLIGHKD